jgi:hypothetical protein
MGTGCGNEPSSMSESVSPEQEDVRGFMTCFILFASEVIRPPGLFRV